MIRIVNGYQIISNLVILILFFIKTKVLFNIDISTTAILIFILLLFNGLFLLGSNIYLLMGKNKFRVNLLKWNYYLNAIQIFSFSLLGLSFDFVFGIRIMPYFSYGEIMDLRIMIDSFDSIFSLFYKESSVILFGINIVPLFFATIFYRQYKSEYKNSKPNE